VVAHHDEGTHKPGLAKSSDENLSVSFAMTAFALTICSGVAGSRAKAADGRVIG